MIASLHNLTSTALRELAGSLVEGPLTNGLSTHIVRQIVGSTLTPEVVQCIQQLRADGWAPRQIGQMAHAIIEARESGSDPERLFDLVLSGPEIPGISTRDTGAVMHTMIEDSCSEVLLVGYAVYKGRMLFERLAQKMAENPQLHVRFCLNIERRLNDTSIDEEIIRRFAEEFNTQHWPWDPKPEVFYDPRSLSHYNTKRSSLHAKCLIVDRRVAMVTSANFTEAAQKRNIEAGILISYIPFVQRIAEYFDTLCRSLLRPCPLSHWEIL